MHSIKHVALTALAVAFGVIAGMAMMGTPPTLGSSAVTYGGRAFDASVPGHVVADTG
jgi:hypothetical protein